MKKIMKPTKAPEEGKQDTPSIEPEDNYIVDAVNQMIKELDPNDEFEWVVSFDPDDKGLGDGEDDVD